MQCLLADACHAICPDLTLPHRATLGKAQGCWIDAAWLSSFWDAIVLQGKVCVLDPGSLWVCMDSGFASGRASDPRLPSSTAWSRPVYPVSPHPCPPGRHIGLSGHSARAGHLRRLNRCRMPQLWRLIIESCSGAHHPPNMTRVSQKIFSLDASLSRFPPLINLGFSCSSLSCLRQGSI